MATLSIDQYNCSPGFLNFQLTKTLTLNMTLKMASVRVVEMSVANNSPSQDSNHPGDLSFTIKVSLLLLSLLLL